jgi:hypothetical protein
VTPPSPPPWSGRPLGVTRGPTPTPAPNRRRRLSATSMSGEYRRITRHNAHLSRSSEGRRAATGGTIDQYTDVFDHAARVNAKGFGRRDGPPGRARAACILSARSLPNHDRHPWRTSCGERARRPESGVGNWTLLHEVRSARMRGKQTIDRRSQFAIVAAS